MNDRPRDDADPLSSASWADELPPRQLSMELLERARTGERDALEELLRRYGERVRRIVRIQLGKSSPLRMQDSVDLVQETLIAAQGGLADLHVDSPAAFLGWLTRIALHKLRDALDYERAAKRDVRRTAPLDAGEAEPPGVVPVARVPGPLAALELAEIRELLDAEVAQLPIDQRRVVLLRDYCGESWDSIAKDLHRERGAARQLHQRAWIRLRSALRPKIEGAVEPDGGSS